jgi:membrane peptidoglycan carboxypeptidase
VSPSGSVEPRRVSARARDVTGTAPGGSADFLPGGQTSPGRPGAAAPQFKRIVAADQTAGGARRGKRQPGAPKRYTRRGKPRYGFFNYPRRQYTGFHRWAPSWRFVWWSFVAGCCLLVGAFLIAYAVIDLPQPASFAQAQTSTVYYADGTTVMGKFQVQNRQIVNVAELPQHVRDVVVAAEDRTFWENAGVDPMALGRAFYNNLKGGARQGGSTITQQYIERYWVGETTTSLSGKFREAMLALKVTREKDKMDILDDYMNTIYFGRGTYGIQAAAQAYFHKDAKDLTLSEAAMIAGVIPAPTNYDPQTNLAAAHSRWSYVLDGMEVMGKLSKSERAALEFPEVYPYEVPEIYAGPQGYLLEMVRQELMAKGGLSDAQIGTAGLKITTTIDKSIQDQAVARAQDMPEDTPPGLHVAVVALDPETGAIKMIYAGDDYIERQQNAATQDIAQAGSTFKPITLAAALEKGIPLEETFSGRSPIKIGDWTVHNAGNSQYGQITLLRATQSSVNTVFAQLNEEVGGTSTRDAAIAAGLPVDTIGLDTDLTNVLGTASVHPIDLARVYATFAAQGVRHDTYIVASAVSPDGNEVYSGRNKGVRVFSEDSMAELTYALTRVVEYGTGTAAQALGRPAAGKTGTSEHNQSAWFCGYTPQLATAVAFYQEGENGEVVPIEPFGEDAVIQGGGPPARMWVDIMTIGLGDSEVVDFPARPQDRATPSRRAPTASATPAAPTTDPSASPTPSVDPSAEPSVEPSDQPSDTPSPDPSAEPSPSEPAPTGSPTTPSTPPPSPSPSPSASASATPASRVSPSAAAGPRTGARADPWQS